MSQSPFFTTIMNYPKPLTYLPKEVCKHMDNSILKGIITNHFSTNTVRGQEFGKYSPSVVCGCLKKAYFEFFNPKQIDGMTKGLFETGNSLHYFVENLLKKSNIFEKIESEKEITLILPSEDRIIISGRADEILYLKNEKERYIIEVKSINDVFKPLPKQEHIIQLMFYLAGLNCKKGFIWYFDRSNYYNNKIFEVEYNHKEFLNIAKNVVYLHNCIKSKTIPQVKECVNDWCDYKEECDG